MNIFIQGMRRSGTTILFDLFWEDGRFDCYYEPLAAAKKAVGGGSGVNPVDYFDKVRTCRGEFIKSYPGLADVNLLNYGAPRSALLEFEQDAPDYIKQYIRFMLSKSEDTLIKFTRVYCKVKMLYDIDPDAKFIHIVRDPRAVAASYLFGKDRKNKNIYGKERVFFKRRSGYSAWSSLPLSESILSMPEYSHLKRCRDYMRVLLVWKYTFINTYNSGKELYGDNYLLLRHEDLLGSPEDTLRTIYRHIGRPLPQNVSDWAGHNIHRNKPPYAHENIKWLEAFHMLDMCKEVALAGYEICDEIKDRSPRSAIMDFFKRDKT